MRGIHFFLVCLAALTASNAQAAPQSSSITTPPSLEENDFPSLESGPKAHQNLPPPTGLHDEVPPPLPSPAVKLPAMLPAVPAPKIEKKPEPTQTKKSNPVVDLFVKEDEELKKEIKQKIEAAPLTFPPKAPQLNLPNFPKVEEIKNKASDSRNHAAEIKKDSIENPKGAFQGPILREEEPHKSFLPFQINKDLPIVEKKNIDSDTTINKSASPMVEKAQDKPAEKKEILSKESIQPKKLPVTLIGEKEEEKEDLDPSFILEEEIFGEEVGISDLDEIDILSGSRQKPLSDKQKRLLKEKVKLNQEKAKEAKMLLKRAQIDYKIQKLPLMLAEASQAKENQHLPEILTLKLMKEGVFQSVLEGNLAALRALVEKDPSLLHCQGKNNNTPLHYAVNAGQVNVVRWLLAKGANPNAINTQQQTPLHIAAYKGNIEILQALLTMGAVPKARDIAGNTAVVYSAQFNQPMAKAYLSQWESQKRVSQLKEIESEDQPASLLRSQTSDPISHISSSSLNTSSFSQK